MLSPVITTGRNAIVRQSKRTLLLKSFTNHTNRHASSSSAFADFGYGIPDAIRKSVKSRVLDEATKSDSQLWSTAQPVNGSTPDADHHTNESSESSINTPLSTLPTDPLTEWHLHATPRYSTHPASSSPTTDPFTLSRPDIDTLSHNIYTNLLQSNHPVLAQAASYFFSPTSTTTGKKIRPTIITLLSRSLPSSSSPHTLLPSQRRLAEISEMIHTASLFHDDVIDNSDTRRGVPAVHKAFGSDKMAILAGDYLLARASVHLARLRNVEVVETMSTIIEDLVRGEVMQMRPPSSSSSSNDDDDAMIYYLRKNFYKTASLMANSCKSTALLAGCDASVVQRAYNYGKHVGVAFQLSDDVLDFEGTAAVTGKPSLSDLRSGLATAPVLFAVMEEEEMRGGGGVLRMMMERRFSGEGDVERAWECVMESDGLRKTKDLARVHAEVAVDEILGLEESDYREALVNLAFRVVDRTR